MAPELDPTTSNGRVTLAVVQNEIRHLCEKQDTWHEEIRDALAEMKRDLRERTDDHESRIRTLEGADKQGVWRDIGALVAAVVAGVVGWFGGK
jgi:DNA-binding transcriptional MerR regulator